MDNEQIRLNFAHNIKEYRNRLKTTQQGLAIKLRTTRIKVDHWENCRQECTLTDLLRISTITGYTMESLILTKIDFAHG